MHLHKSKRIKLFAHKIHKSNNNRFHLDKNHHPTSQGQTRYEKKLGKLTWGLLCLLSVLIIIPVVLYCLSRILYLCKDLVIDYLNFLLNYFHPVSAAIITIISVLLFLFGLVCAFTYAFNSEDIDAITERVSTSDSGN